VDIYSGKIVYYYGKKKNQDIYRLEDHIEIAAGCQKQKPPESIWKKKIKPAYKYEKNNKMNGIKEHKRPDYFLKNSIRASVWTVEIAGKLAIRKVLLFHLP
jgi:hypothetical protein